MTNQKTNRDSKSITGQQPFRTIPTRTVLQVVGVLIVLMALVLAAGVWWHSATPTEDVSLPTRPSASRNQEPESTRARAQTDALRTMSTSHEIDAIRSDLESTNIDSLLRDLDAIETELELRLR